jgi:hypothetical protein
MPCHHVDLGGGAHAIVRTAPARGRKCSVCGVTTKEPKLCDFPVGGGRTCSAVLCKACARPAPTGKSEVEPAPEDYCPLHDDFLSGRLKL